MKSSSLFNAYQQQPRPEPDAPPPPYSSFSEDQQAQQQQQQHQEPDATSTLTPEELRLKRFRDIVDRHEISRFMALKMRRLEAYDLVIIADDSGSMQTRSTQTLTDPFAKSLTRWDELKSTLSIITEIGALMDENGVDVYFLNRDPIRGIKGPHSPELDAAFMDPPMGYTPTTRVLRQVLRDKGVSTAGASHSVDRSKKLLILIATDGQPTNDAGALMKDELYQSLLTERGPDPSNGSVVVTFLICSDDENEMRFLNGWDKRIPCLDVVDDYQAERRQILQVQGLEFPFSKGDWVCKMLLGGLDSEIDLLDERRVGGGGGDVVAVAGAGGSGSSGLNPGAAVSGLARRLSNSDCCIQ